MSSGSVVRLAKYSNNVERNFTCENAGKLTKIARAADTYTPKDKRSRIKAFGGMADFAVPTLVSGNFGII